MMSEREVHRNILQRIIVIFLTNKSVRLTEILQTPREPVRLTGLKKPQVYEWRKMAACGKTSRS